MIYVHVPFCRSFCTYCDFYSEVASGGCGREEVKFEAFARALSSEIQTRRGDFSGGTDTLYIGGGTPSVLPLSVLRHLAGALEEAGQGGPYQEFTVEVNPDDIVSKGEKYVEGLLDLGVNRVSMGVQSFDDDILRWMNRRHDSATARKAYAILENAGVLNVSIDLIFGLPQLSDLRWRETLAQALEISQRGEVPRHISSYQLSVEPGSALAALQARGKWEEASEELCSRQYDILCEELKSAGYHHYEISNFAQPGNEAVHNSAYWRHVPYVGLGPGAHSFLSPTGSGMCVRQWNEPDLDKYLLAARTGDFAEVRGQETLTHEQIALERVMLGLRTSAGLPEAFLRENCGDEAVGRALAAGDLIRCESDGLRCLRIPESRFFVSDSIISSL